MRKSAVFIMMGSNLLYHLDEIRIVKSFDDWNGFGKRKVRAYYPGEGYGVFCRFTPSRLDVDLAENSIQARLIKRLMEEKVAFYWVPKEEELQVIREAMDRSDELTHRLLGHGWFHGKRPYFKLWELM